MSRAERTAKGVPIEAATWEELRVAADSVGTTLDG
jgi:LDH2 family malate/lactate/ureidoglycolate dehydrogenase